MEEKMRCPRFLSFAFVALSVFFSGLFITTQNSFAVSQTINLPAYGVNVCNSSTTLCSDFSYVSVLVSGSGSNLSTVLNLIADGSTFSRLNFSPTNLYALDHVFYIPIPSGISSLNIESNFAGTLTYELLDSLIPDCPASPSGDISITSNGTYDVSSYATATVDVPAEVIQGDYHYDLVNIQKSIIVCGAVLLVLYFFYCIYRLIIKNSGVK